MEPLSALAIASAVIQIVDFSSKVIVRTREAYLSTDGSTEETTLLEDAAANLNELMVGLQTSISYRTGGNYKRTLPDDRLLQLAEESHTLAVNLREILDKVKLRKDGSQRNALDQGIRSVLEQKNISAMKDRLDEIRKQVDTTLLFVIRQKMELGSTKPTNSDETDATKRRLELLATIKNRDWKPTTQEDITEFSDRLISSVDMDLEERFCYAILGRLYFADMPDRHESIPVAHQETFSWVFDGKTQLQHPRDWDSFADWLSGTDENNIYWATGKPGSGKSTLMKFMFNDDRTRDGLQAWMQGQPLVKAGFFFWNSGTVMQASRLGLLQSLLHASLENDRTTLLRIFKNRWQQFVGFGGGRQPFTWPELRQALEDMISAPETPRKFFYMIDGMDEFSGNPKELIELIFSMAKYPYVKLCVASRPWLVFSDAFGHRPSLRLEDLTKNDVRNYITSFFANNEHYARLTKIEPVGASVLIRDIAEKSAGVFLWVYLVVQSLLDGLSNADRLSDLAAKLEQLPPDLEDLYAKLLNSLDAQYFKHACQLFRLVVEIERPPLLDLYFADTEKDDSALLDDIKDLSAEQITDRLETMNRRLMSRCKGFLEIENRLANPDQVLSDATRVGWIHRTARDFLQTEDMWRMVLEATGHDEFNAGRRWANAFMGMFKAVNSTIAIKWAELKLCIDCAIVLECLQNACPVEYLDELGRTAMQRCKIYPTSISAPRIKRPTLLTFLDIAVWYRLASYVKIKGSTMTYDEIIHATKFKGLPLPESELNDARRKHQNSKWPTYEPEPPTYHRDNFYLSAGAATYLNAQQRLGSKFPSHGGTQDPAKMEEALEHILKLHKQERWKGKLRRTKKKFFG